MSDFSLQFLIHFAHDPVVAIYSMQAATYAFAALVSRSAGHGPLAGVYMASAALHALLCASHLIA